MRCLYWLLAMLAVALALASTPACCSTANTEIETIQGAELRPELAQRILGPSVKVLLEFDTEMDGGYGRTGTGVLVERVGDVYYVLTCQHVVDVGWEHSDATNIRYTVTVRGLGEVEAKLFRISGHFKDMALLCFDYDGELPLAMLPDRNPALLSQVYSVGWLYDTKPPYVSMGLFCSYDSCAPNKLPRGWTVTTHAWFGYSGGGVFNSQGQLIGLNAVLDYDVRQDQIITWHVGIVALPDIIDFLQDAGF